MDGTGTAIAPDAGTNKRFAFGRNWRRFLSVLNDERLAVAEDSLREMLEADSLAGKSFLDIGSGSGLFSLAAARLGASRIHSFDYDPDSVACTGELKRRYRPAMEAWTIERGSALDEGYLASLGQYDIVYSWGVLHHTGNLWRALELVTPRVKPGGKLFIAIYNDRGWVSRAWTFVKRVYNAGWAGAALVTGIFVPIFVAKGLAGDLLRFRNPLTRYREYRKQRGMSVVHDWLDWLGGYPYEVAAPEKIIDLYRQRGLVLKKLKDRRHLNGNNEFVFLKPE
ncbi:MAG TPA: class I SAM-dependent methyltransferase [Terriglobia bacterium]